MFRFRFFHPHPTLLVLSSTLLFPFLPPSVTTWVNGPGVVKQEIYLSIYLGHAKAKSGHKSRKCSRNLMRPHTEWRGLEGSKCILTMLPRRWEVGVSGPELSEDGGAVVGLVHNDGRPGSHLGLVVGTLVPVDPDMS